MSTSAKPRLPAIFVANASDAAVYDVFVDHRAPVNGARVRVSLGPVSPGGSRIRVIDYDGRLGDGWEPAALSARVHFRDSAGDRWLRDSIGRLRIDPGAGDDDFLDQDGVLLPPD